ncbi:hypothetical protein HII31_03212 [Pseudocercospora fuligena]|uniref:Aminotransferase class I/classII large domain-containing protein n=1 Tax=Pseudocercospora fuligena TaxID=685502 RepID=A0A8H6VQL4_9PEZI|nr:hypothetical protein HII31_03212 [Pseudocercospora fuligena]
MSSEEAINLLRGWPSQSLLPVDLVREAANAALSDPSIALPGLLYGPDEGYEPAREAVASWLTSFYRPSDPIGVDRICITGAASQNLAVMLGVYTDPVYTRNIWIVSPAYMLAFRIFEDAGFSSKMRAIPEDEEGIDIDYLRREIQKSEDTAQEQGNHEPRFKPDRKRAKVYKHVIYCVPTFSNPSSRTMSLKRRQQLVRLAREYDALVTCDDVYDVLHWSADTSLDPRVSSETMKTSQLPRLVDVDRELEDGAERKGADGFGNVHSNGTMSKILGPGLRMGWAEGTPKLVYGLSQAGCQRSGGAPSQLTSTYITRLLQEGKIQTHTQTVLCPAYAARYMTMMLAIKQHLHPLGFTAPQPDREVVGGYFIWLGLPSGLDDVQLAETCQKDEDLVIAPGKLFEVPGDDALSFSNSIRLCFAWEDEPKLRVGIERIARVATKLLNAKEDGSGEYVVVHKDGGQDMLQSFR